MEHIVEVVTSTSPEVRVVHSPSRAGVSVRIARGVQGTAVEVEVTRPLGEGESYDACREHAVASAVLAYDDAVTKLARLGVTPGKDR